MQLKTQRLKKKKITSNKQVNKTPNFGFKFSGSRRVLQSGPIAYTHLYISEELLGGSLTEGTLIAMNLVNNTFWIL